MRIGYIHMIGGASGDMLLGALLDAGLSPADLEAELTKLPVPGCAIAARRDHRGGLPGTHVTLDTGDGAAESVRMDWRDFADAIANSGLSPSVAQRCAAVLRLLEDAERSVHGSAPGDPSPHPHELGTLDTLVDVVGTVAGLELLGIERLYAGPIPMGSGVIKSDHGPLPAAAPATMALAAMANAPVVPPPEGYTGEMVTPTGAALITGLAEFDRPRMRLERVGYGLGTRNPATYPNAVALWIGEAEDAPLRREITLLETNIDDASPQLLGYAQELLFDLGALDVWHTPIQMKKNRPGVLLSVLVPASLEAEAVSALLRETTTLGVRRRDVERYEAERESRVVDTAFGPVQVKVKLLDGRPVAAAPEYDACRAIARERGVPLQEVLARVTQAAREQLLGEPTASH